MTRVVVIAVLVFLGSVGLARAFLLLAPTSSVSSAAECHFVGTAQFVGVFQCP